MEKWYGAIGKLRYCNNSGWVVLDTSFSIVKYYSYWIKKLEWKNGSTPLHNAHISIINGKFEDARKSPFWGLHQGALINFEYSSVVMTDEKREYFWLKVKSPRLEEIRKELSLKPQLKWPLHLTIFYIER